QPGLGIDLLTVIETLAIVHLARHHRPDAKHRIMLLGMNADGIGVPGHGNPLLEDHLAHRENVLAPFRTKVLAVTGGRGVNEGRLRYRKDAQFEEARGALVGPQTVARMFYAVPRTVVGLTIG